MYQRNGGSHKLRENSAGGPVEMNFVQNPTYGGGTGAGTDVEFEVEAGSNVYQDGHELLEASEVEDEYYGGEASEGGGSEYYANVEVGAEEPGALLALGGASDSATHSRISLI